MGQKLFLTVQSKVLPRFGFEGSLKGAMTMMAVFTEGPNSQALNMDANFNANARSLNYLLDIWPPPAVISAEERRKRLESSSAPAGQRALSAHQQIQNVLESPERQVWLNSLNGNVPEIIKAWEQILNTFMPQIGFRPGFHGLVQLLDLERPCTDEAQIRANSKRMEELLGLASDAMCLDGGWKLPDGKIINAIQDGIKVEFTGDLEYCPFPALILGGYL